MTEQEKATADAEELRRVIQQHERQRAKAAAEEAERRKAEKDEK